MARVARGKALVAKLRAQAGVRDPEALAAWIGRFKQARKAGKSVSEATKAAGGSKTPRSPLADLAAESEGSDIESGVERRGGRGATRRRR